MVGVPPVEEHCIIECDFDKAVTDHNLNFRVIIDPKTVSKLAGSNPAKAVGFLGAKKILSTPSFGGEVKPSVPCRRFAACKRSLNVPWKSCI